MNKQRFYVNGNELITRSTAEKSDHVRVREIIAKNNIEVDDFSPKLTDNPLRNRKVVNTIEREGFMFEFIEPSGFNLMGMEMKAAKLPTVLYQRI